MWTYVIIGGILGFIPGVAFVLVAVEAWMIHSIAHNYHVDNVGELVAFILGAGALSLALKAIAHTMHLAPLIGQIANSIVAMVFIVALYHVADSHYAQLAKMNLHPNTIPNVPLSSESR